MKHRLLRSALLATLPLVLLVSTAAIATSLTISAARLTTFTRTYGTPSTCSLQPTSDSHVRAADADADTNYGTLPTLEVRADTSSIARALVRFDLSSCSPAIPADALVHSATLRLTLFSNATATRTYDLVRSIEPWSETTVTWNSQPTVASGTTSSVSLSSGTNAPSVVEWSVVADVQDLVSGAAPNYGWMLKDSAEDAAVEIVFHAREAASNSPELVIVYAD